MWPDPVPNGRDAAVLLWEGLSSQLGQQFARKEQGDTQPSGMGPGAAGAMAVGRERWVLLNHVTPGCNLLWAGGRPSLEK